MDYQHMRSLVDRIKCPLKRRIELANLEYLIQRHQDLDAFYDQLLRPKNKGDETTRIIHAHNGATND